MTQREREIRNKEIELYNRFLDEKAILERFGHTSVVTFKEWCKIKGFKE